MFRTSLHILYTSIFLVYVCVPLSCFPGVPAQTVASGDSASIHQLYRGASIRFIENNGQYPEGILYVAPIHDGYILFMRDRIMLQQFEPYENEAKVHTLPSPPRSLLSELQTGDDKRPMHRESRSVTKLIASFDSLTWGSPGTLGLRTERVNYFGAGYSKRNTALNVSTWDTLFYRNTNDGIDMSFFCSNSTISYNFIQHDAGSESRWELLKDLVDQLDPYMSDIDKPTNVIKQSKVDVSSRLVYSTLFGGSKTDGIGSILQARKNVYYLIGSTKSLDFPIAGSPYCDTYKADTSSRFANMVFIACLDILNNVVIFSTYFGGSDLDGALAAALDRDGNIVFAGSTWSNDLPTTDNAFQKTYRGEGDGYVAAIDSTGSRLVFCSYLGGTDVENLRDMKIDAEGNIVLTGITMSRNFPTTPGVVQRSYGGGEDDMFVAKLNSDASQLLFGTYFGGNGYDEGRRVRLTESGDILVAGYTNSDNFPVTPDALYSRRAAFDEGCVFILSPDGSRIIYSTYIGWNAYENAHEAHLDSDGVMTVFGITTSDDLPVTSTAFQQQKGEYPDYNPYSFDFYILRYHVASAKILACTYLGGSGNDRYPETLIPMSDGRFFFGGIGVSGDYPATDSIASTTLGMYSPQLTIMSDDLSEIDFSLRFGGSHITDVRFALIQDNHLYLAGFTYWQDYPVTSSAYQIERKGETDGYFMILDLSDILTDVRESPHAVPFAILHPNYPNPARSGATIPYSLSQPGHVRLSIHDMLGRVVATPVDTFLPAGEHKSMFNTALLPSGTYIIRMLSENGQQSRLMQVLQR
jgi:hypothetical protein